MKTRYVLAALSAVALAAACSTDDSRPGPVQEQEVTLAIQGVNAGDYSSALMVMSDAYAMADGVKVPVQIDRARADLADPNDGLRVRLTLPASAESVQVRVELDDFGAYVAGSRAGQVDTRGTPLRFTMPAAGLRNGALLRLDLGRSIVPPNADKRFLLPHFDLTPR